MNQALKDGIKAITAKIRQNAPNPITEDIIHNCDLIDEQIDNAPTTDE